MLFSKREIRVNYLFDNKFNNKIININKKNRDNNFIFNFIFVDKIFNNENFK